MNIYAGELTAFQSLKPACVAVMGAAASLIKATASATPIQGSTEAFKLLISCCDKLMTHLRELAQELSNTRDVG